MVRKKPKNHSNRIAGITVRGFKSICTEQYLEIKPLTIFAGANSSGKTSIIQPLLLLKQTLDEPSDPGPLLLNGPNVQFSSSEQIRSNIKERKCDYDFSIKINLFEKESLELVFQRKEKVGFEIERMIHKTKNEYLDLKPKMNKEEILNNLPASLKELFKRQINQNLFHFGINRERCFLSIILTIEKDTIPLPFFLFDPPFIQMIQGIIHLPGLRGNPLRTYQKTAVGPNFQGTFQNYVASIISQWQSEKSSKLSLLGKTLEEMGLTWKVEAKRIEDTQVELRVGRLVHRGQNKERDMINIADIGFGVSQVLPVIVALLVAKPGQLVYLEQPEIHLHPLAQRKLAKILADASKRSVVTVVETHSSLLIREIQILVAKNIIPKNDIILHWFHREADGSAIVNTGNLNDRGAYGNWPTDFDKIELDSEKDYLDAVEFRRKRG